MYRCKTCKYTFPRFAEQLVMWSKKAEPCCPSCGAPKNIGIFEKIEKRQKQLVK